MKKLFILLLIYSIVLSCTKGTDPETEATNNDLAENLQTREEMAKMLSTIATDKTDFDFVINEVGKSMEDGLDEDCFFRDIMNVDTRSTGNSLREKIINYCSQTKSSSTENILDNIENYKIYWPYSKYWDKITMPTITFVPEDENQEWNYGYVFNKSQNGEIELNTVIVNEEYAMQNPVWVISQDDTNKDIPVLKTCNEPEKIEYMSDLGPITKSRGTLYSIKMVSFKCTKHYDGLFRGASDFWISIGNINNITLVDNSFRFTVAPVRQFMIKAHRYQINDKTPIYPSSGTNFLIQEWEPELSSSAMLIIEDDGGKSTSQKIKSTLSSNGITTTVDTEVRFKKKDTNLGINTLHKNFLFRDDNGAWPFYKEDEFFHTDGISYVIGSQKY